MRGSVRALLRRVLPAALLLAGTVAASAQDSIPRPDTLRVPIPDEARRADTLPDLGRDTLRADTLPADSTLAAPNFPEFPQHGPAGFGPGVWVWDREALARWHGLSLEEFLDRVPGVVVTRSGSLGRPTGASPYGGGGGRVRIYLDGWELRELNGGTADLQRVQLADVVALRIQRGMGEVRVDISTFRLSDRRPYAQLEGSDGDFDSRALRPFFAQPWGSRVVLQLGLDLVETAGFRRAEDFGANTPFARISYLVRPELGVQLDYRSTSWSLDPREFAGNGIPGEQLTRSELMLRGRGHIGRLWLDGAVGRSRQSPADGDSLVQEISSTQLYARAALDLEAGSLVGTARVHRGEEASWAPDEQELAVAASFTPGRGISAGGDLRHRTRGGQGGLEMEGWARAALAGGFAVFGSIANGDRAVSYLLDSVRVVRNIGGGLPGQPELDTLPAAYFRGALPTLRALRAGGEFARGRWALGAAYVLHDVSTVVPYGNYADTRIGLVPAEGDAMGAVEGYARLPLPWEGFTVDGWFLMQTQEAVRPYLPKYFGRAAVEFHDTFRAGNLEPTLRMEVVGRSRAPLPGGTVEAPLEAPRYAIINAFVQVRILDIRLFWRMENLFNNTSGSDLLETRLPGARQLYGVRWFFRN